HLEDVDRVAFGGHDGESLAVERHGRQGTIRRVAESPELAQPLPGAVRQLIGVDLRDESVFLVGRLTQDRRAAHQAHAGDEKSADARHRTLPALWYKRAVLKFVEMSLTEQVRQCNFHPRDPRATAPSPSGALHASPLADTTASRFAQFEN